MFIVISWISLPLSYKVKFHSQFQFANGAVISLIGAHSFATGKLQNGKNANLKINKWIKKSLWTSWIYEWADHALCNHSVASAFLFPFININEAEKKEYI